MGEIVKTKGKRQEAKLADEVLVQETVQAKPISELAKTLELMEKELASFDHVAVMFHLTMIKLKFKELIEKAKTQI